MSIGNECAFPCPETDGNVFQPGLSYREWLIGMAMQGLCANGDGTIKSVAEEAILHADAVLILLEEKT